MIKKVLLITFFIGITQTRVMAMSSDEKLSKAVDLARTILRDAYDADPEGSTARTIRKIQNSLVDTKFFKPDDGQNYVRCIQNERVLAYTVNGSYVYICQEVMENSVEYIAQTIIHEAVHLAGIDNECEVSEFEVYSMINGHTGPVYNNGYIEECGIEI